MLHQEFGHDLPCFPGGGVGIVGAVNLKHVYAGHEFFSFSSIDKRTDHVDIAVQDIVLGVLVSPVYSFFSEEDGN